ncbi:MAG: sugar ABC transporter substrate-binding protein [Geminicoccaceae bacterium]|nr:sugar ABC transporter substrate-binding protein [Geminicoccaceae bacterium]MCB9967593.1 sugar ABC transporter substrate-binding protein [Geminicoccaceae bacterium]
MRKLTLAATVALLTGAGGASAQTLSLVEVITSPPRTEQLRAMVDQFEAANPGVTVEITSLPWGQAFERLATMVQGGQTPDVVEMPDRWLSLYANAGQLVDLTPFLAEWDGTAELTDATKSFGSVISGQTHMIPYGFYLRAMFWNKKLFAEAGLDRAPETLQEFYDFSAKIAELDGKYGYCLRGGPGATNGYIMMMLNFLGENKYFNEDGTSTLDDPKAIEGLQFIVDMYQNGLVPRDSVNWGFNEIVAGFYSGTCAMLDQDPDALIAIKERMPAEDFAVAPMPLGPAGKSFPTIGYAGWSIFEASEHKDVAFDLIAHLSSREMNLEWSKFVGVIPIHVGAEQDPFFTGPNFEGWFVEINDDRWEPTSMPTYLEEFGYFADVVSIQGGQEALLGQRTAEEVATEWADYLTPAQQKWLAAQ